MPDCTHHWIIAPANGPLSKGRCRKCKAEQMFANTVQDTAAYWADKGKRSRMKGTAEGHKAMGHKARPPLTGS